jgi:hypothetical protein
VIARYFCLFYSTYRRRTLRSNRSFSLSTPSSLASGVYFCTTMNRTTPTLSKTCPTCELEKDAVEFNKHGGQKDGLSTTCKECLKKYQGERQATIKKAAQSHPNDPKVPPIRSITPPPQSAPKTIPDAPEPTVTFPPIKETEHRGQSRRSYSFQGPDGFSIFAFDSFAEARKAANRCAPNICRP